MSLSFTELFALATSGFVCGSAIGCGFALQAIRVLYVHHWNKWRETAWIAAMILVMAFVCLAPVFLIAIMVFGDDPSGPLFWPRLFFFVLGVLLGATFVFGSVYVINQGIRLRDTVGDA